MPYKDKKDRPYKKEWQQQKARDENKSRAARARARYAFDKAGIDRTGKDIDHKDKNPKNNSRSNLRVRSKSSNRADNR